jgi:uncharacterized membrane protein
MFEALFKYSPVVFSKGQLVFMSRWPLWVWAALVAVVALVIAATLWRRRERITATLRGPRLAAIAVLQTALAALLLLLLWQPAISIATLKPQQNVIAVVIDDSRSMAIREDGATRRDRAVQALNGGTLDRLRDRFLVRLYSMSSQLERIGKAEELTASKPSTRIGDSLKQVVAEAASLPIGAVVLLTDGADNSGGVDLATMSEVRSRRIPIHTVGFGHEQFPRDLEVGDVQIPARVLADSRLNAVVSLRQRGYAKSRARLAIKDGSKVLAAREITLAADGVQQTEQIMFNAGAAGAKSLNISVEPLNGEENRDNNALTRLVNVEAGKPRILYLEGEPRWEFKFIRRAIDEDRSLQLVSMLRTTQNKIYRQGVADPKELEHGFPAKVEELFGYQAVILGGVEANYLTQAQQEALKQFVDRRGGGVLFLAGRAGLAEGGYATSLLTELLPVALPSKQLTFHRDPATVELTPAGREHTICRIEEDSQRNAERWKKLPYVANYQEVGAAKPGAAVLAEMNPGGRGRLPLLVVQSYGLGRTALFATAGSWRWQMQQELADKSHEMFWQQLLRWLVSDARGRVISSTPQPVLQDHGRVPLRVKVRDTTYLPAADAAVEAHVMGPEGISATVTLTPDPVEAGEYSSDFLAEKPGAYLAEVVARRGEEEVGRDMLTFRREDGVAESFRAEQNRELLEKLSSQTGGRYYRASDLSRLPDDISYSEAGINTRENRELWNMPAILLALLLLKGAEWILRRRWGAV